MTTEQRYHYRLQEAEPILNNIHEWLENNILKSPPKGRLAKAMKYMLNRWHALTHYLKDGRLDIDNNLIENAIRPFAIGRKNWLFKGNPRGAKAGALFYTLIASAKANGLDPFKYLNAVFNQLPLCKTEDDFRALLPWAIQIN